MKGVAFFISESGACSASCLAVTVGNYAVTLLVANLFLVGVRV